MTSATQPRAGASETSATNATTQDTGGATTAAPRRWVTVLTVDQDSWDKRRVEKRLELTTGTARFVLDEFEVGSENGSAHWYILGSDQYHSEARGACEGPPTSSPPDGYPPTTANPSPVGPPCTPGYEARFDIAPGSYSLRVDFSQARWKARIQELR